MRMSLHELKAFEKALNDFESNVVRDCNNLEQGISSCRSYMKDENSGRALARGEKVAEDIKSCINPTQMLLEKIRRLISEYEKQEEMTF